MIAFRAVIGALLLLVVPSLAVASRALPDADLTLPVAITLDNGSSGSGFFLHDGDAIYLVTAKHVFYSPDGVLQKASAVTLLSYPKPPQKGRNVFRFLLPLFASQGRLKSKGDVLMVRLGTVDREGQTNMPGLLPVEQSGRMTSASRSQLKKLADVLVSNDVYVFGYPRSLGLKALPQVDPNRSLLRRGVVADVNPALRVIVLDCPVYPGNSGGPALEVDQTGDTKDLWVIGVVSQWVPWVNDRLGKERISLDNSGYSIVAPADFILELLDEPTPAGAGRR